MFDTLSPCLACAHLSCSSVANKHKLECWYFSHLRLALLYLPACVVLADTTLGRSDRLRDVVAVERGVRSVSVVEVQMFWKDSTVCQTGELTAHNCCECRPLSDYHASPVGLCVLSQLVASWHLYDHVGLYHVLAMAAHGQRIARRSPLTSDIIC